MSTAKERYYKSGFSDQIIVTDYVSELEQELEDEKENHTHFKKCWLEEFKLRHELEQQVEELKKELQANNMFTNEKIKNYNSGYEKLVDIKIGSHHVTKK